MRLSASVRLSLMKGKFWRVGIWQLFFSSDSAEAREQLECLAPNFMTKQSCNDLTIFLKLSKIETSRAVLWVVNYNHRWRSKIIIRTVWILLFAIQSELWRRIRFLVKFIHWTRFRFWSEINFWICRTSWFKKNQELKMQFWKNQHHSVTFVLGNIFFKKAKCLLSIMPWSTQILFRNTMCLRVKIKFFRF